MARDEHAREDLLKEATALVERAEFASPGGPIVVGFRRDGSASIYFDDDPVYHFTSTGQLRRAYHQGRLYKAERGRLVSLDRRRVPGAVQLLRHELSDDETSEFLGELTERLRGLRSALGESSLRLVGQAPQSSDVSCRIGQWLDRLMLPPPIADSPRAK